MAAAHSGAPDLEDFCSSTLICGICLEDFKDPRALPCLHTFCHDCLLGLHRQSGWHRLVCPSCREVCVARPRDLRRNFHVARLLELRPLLTTGLRGLRLAAEDFAARARDQLASLPQEAELDAAAGHCHQELASLRARKRSLEEVLDAAETAVSAERESLRRSFEDARIGHKNRQRWIRDCLAARSVSQRVIECAASGSHQTLPDLIQEFQRRCSQPPVPAPAVPAVSADGARQARGLLTRSQLRRRLVAQLKGSKN